MSCEEGSGAEISELIYQLRCKCINRDETIREEIDLSPAEFRVLCTLTPEDQVSGSLFAERIELSPSRSSRVIDRMIQNGYLTAMRNSSDKRGITISLTERGVDLKAKIDEERQQCNDKLEQLLPIEERLTVRKTLKKLIDSM
jgi:DNA-binding MarR family transcriptional regulator